MIDFNIFTILSTARVYTISCLYMLVTFITITFFFFSSAVIVIQFWTLSRYSCTAYVLYILDLASTNFYFSEPTEHSVSFYIVCLLVRIKKKFWKFRKKLYGKFRTIDWFIISNKSHRKLKWFHEIFFRFLTLQKKKKKKKIRQNDDFYEMTILWKTFSRTNIWWLSWIWSEEDWNTNLTNLCHVFVFGNIQTIRTKNFVKITILRNVDVTKKLFLLTKI